MLSNINSGLVAYLDNIQTKMHNTLGSYYILDKERRFLCANQEEADLLQFPSADAMIGKTLQNTENERFEIACSNHDAIVLQSQKAMTFTECCMGDDNQIKLLTSYKKPFYYKDKIIGVEGLSLEINLNSINVADCFHESLCFLNVKTNKILDLSLSQRRILFYALKGFTAKEVANKIFLSTRTVQNHLAAIKDNAEYKSIKKLLLNTIVL